jgi:hypothetical protein
LKVVEESLYMEDRKFLDWKQYRNELEAYSYEMRGNMEPNGSYEKYVDPGTKATFMAEIAETVEWLYAAGEQASL